MAIKVGGTIVIDNSRNFSLGIATVGSGNSTITLSSGSMIIGTGVTINSVNGNINASAGILTAAGISYPLGLG